MQATLWQDQAVEMGACQLVIPSWVAVPRAFHKTMYMNSNAWSQNFRCQAPALDGHTLDELTLLRTVC